MVLYTGPDPDQRWFSLERHYDGTEEEDKYEQELPSWKVKEWRLYCIGHKLMHNIDTVDPLEIRIAYEIGNGIIEMTDVATDNPDPRLADANFEVIDTVEVYKEALAGYDGRDGKGAAEKKELTFFIWGATIRYPQWDADKVLQAFDGPQRDELIHIGKDFARRRKEARWSDISRDGEHMDKKAHHGHVPRTMEPTAADTAHFLEQLVSMMNRSGDLDRWEYVCTIAQQGEDLNTRVLYLFQCIDDDNTVLDEMVIKILPGHPEQIYEIGESEFGLHMKLLEILKNTGNTGNQTKCIADSYGWSVRKREKPGQEIWLHTQLHEITFTNTMIQTYGYLEFCPYGDMSYLVNTNLEDKQHPEFFIWLTIRSMAEAVLLLHASRAIAPTEPEDDTYDPGTANEDIPGAAPADEWTPLVNVDIKTSNICLGKELAQYPAFKSIKMIDFGLCYALDDKSLSWRARMQRKAPGTPGWRPPELAGNPVDEAFNKRNPITVATSIASIGLVALNLMEGRDLYFPDMDHWMSGHPTLEAFSDRYENVYSSQLVDLVWECLRRESQDRPRLWELLHRAKKGIERWQKKNGSLVHKALGEVEDREKMIWDNGYWRIGVPGPLKRASDDLDEGGQGGEGGSGSRTSKRSRNSAGATGSRGRKTA
ncbi:unnamed protein product [Periconia digitata]|uniref:non-specific serine/threonine protein kinase n=1 Tax=Periconia digitata TaxID=1303443 RepID=A0A9W4XMU1_9PLEO|nr:unnamed protein product [Periconia digitata]